MPRQQAASAPTLVQPIPTDDPSVRAWSNWRRTISQAPPFLTRLIQPFLPRSLFGWRGTDSILPWSPENPYAVVRPHVFISTLHHYMTTLSCNHIYPRIIELTSQTVPSRPALGDLEETRLTRPRKVERCLQRHLNDARERIASANCGPVIYHYRALMEEYVRVTLEVANEDPDYQFLDRALVTCASRCGHNLFKFCGQSGCPPQSLPPPTPPTPHLPLPFSNEWKMPQTASFSSSKPPFTDPTVLEHPARSATPSRSGRGGVPRWFSKISRSSALSKLPCRILLRRRVRGASEPPARALPSFAGERHPGPATHPSPDFQSLEMPSSSCGMEATGLNAPENDGMSFAPQCGGWPVVEFPGHPKPITRDTPVSSTLSSPLPNLPPISNAEPPSAQTFISQNYITPRQHGEAPVIINNTVVAAQNSAFAPVPITFPNPTKKAAQSIDQVAGEHRDDVSASLSPHRRERQCVVPGSEERAKNDFTGTASDQGGQGDDEFSTSLSSPPPGTTPTPETNQNGEFDARRDHQVNPAVKTVVWIQQCTEDMERFGPSYFEDPNQSPASGRRIAIKFQGEPVTTTHVTLAGSSLSNFRNRCQPPHRHAPYPAGSPLLNRGREGGHIQRRGPTPLRRRNAFNPWDPEPEYLPFQQLAREHEQRCNQAQATQTNHRTGQTCELPSSVTKQPVNAELAQTAAVKNRCVPSNPKEPFERRLQAADCMVTSGSAHRVALPSPSVLEGSVTEAASYIMGGGSSQPIAMAAAPTLTADDAASAMLPVNGSHPVFVGTSNLGSPFRLRDSRHDSPSAVLRTHFPEAEMLGRPSQRLDARYSTVLVASDAPISAGTRSHTRTRGRQQAIQNPPAGSSFSRSRARLARQEAMSSPLRPVIRSKRALPLTAGTPTAAMSSLAHRRRSMMAASSKAGAISSSSRMARNMSRHDGEAVIAMVPQTPISRANIPTTPVRRSPRKRTRDDDDDRSAQQACEGKKARIS